MNNLHYKTDRIKDYFSENRVRWEQFYKSEQVMLANTLGGLSSPSILDVGCGCGGLGLALRDHFGLNDYTGIEINVQAAKHAKELNPGAQIECGDFLELNANRLSRSQFDVVISLSCIDWQLNFQRMLERAWSLVKPNGYFVISLRLTDAAGVNDIKSSYQFINYNGLRKGERAPYVVLNCSDIMQTFVLLGASKVAGYGYFGLPSSTAVTPYKELCFAVLAVTKSPETYQKKPLLSLELPERIASLMEDVIPTEHSNAGKSNG